MFPNNWTSFRPLQSAACNSLMRLPARIYRCTGIVLPRIPFVLRRIETVKIYRSYTCVPHAQYYPNHVEYTKEICNSNALDQYNFDSGAVYQGCYGNQDNNTYECTNNVNTSTYAEITDTANDEVMDDPLGFYLTLPKELFPSARNIMLDPNPIIDEFCKLSSIESHAPWILDLEFGIPRTPSTRSVPMYNIKFNSIHCMNAPDVVHPDFEKCNQDFKRVLLFYYDYIVSAWYNGYIILTHDGSVDNFQSWLSVPIQVLGMCWS